MLRGCLPTNPFGLLAALLLASGAMADDRSPASPWNTGTAPPAAHPAAALPPPGTALGVRVYEGLAPVAGPLDEDRAFAVDAVAEMRTCPDGSRQVSSLTVGGTRYPVAQRCPGDTTTNTTPAPEGAPVAVRCDARTWACRSQR